MYVCVCLRGALHRQKERERENISPFCGSHPLQISDKQRKPTSCVYRSSAFGVCEKPFFFPFHGKWCERNQRQLFSIWIKNTPRWKIVRINFDGLVGNCNNNNKLIFIFAKVLYRETLFFVWFLEIHIRCISVCVCVWAVCRVYFWTIPVKGTT